MDLKYCKKYYKIKNIATNILNITNILNVFIVRFVFVFLRTIKRKKLNLIPKKNDQNEQCDYGIEKKTDLFM